MLRLCCSAIGYQQAFRAGRLDMFGFLKLARELNMDGVDLHARSFDSQERQYLKEIKERCVAYGLSIACVSISNDFANPGGGPAEEVAMTKGWIDVAQFLGAPVVRVFAGNTPSGETEEVAWGRVVDGLRQVALYGKDVGVKVALQNHNHLALAKTGDDVLRMIEQVGPDLLGHVLDTGQYAGSPGASGNTVDNQGRFNFYRSMEQTAHLAVFVRAKLYYGGSRATGRKDAVIDYDRVFDLLRRVNYNGFISLVYEGLEAEETAIPKGVEFLRGYIERARAQA